MNNKFLVIAAATTTALGTALVWTPTHAQTAGSNVPVNLNITVPEVLFLKTVKDINVNLSGADLASQFAGLPTGGFAFDNNSGTAGTGQVGVNTQTPFAGTATSKITQTIPNVYTVWSNSPRGIVNITFNKTGSNPNTTLTLSGGSDTATYSVVSGNLTGLVPQGLVTPTQIGGVTLDIDLTAAKTAGVYQGGTLFVTADAP